MRDGSARTHGRRHDRDLGQLNVICAGLAGGSDVQVQAVRALRGQRDTHGNQLLVTLGQCPACERLFLNSQNAFMAPGACSSSTFGRRRFFMS